MGGGSNTHTEKYEDRRVVAGTCRLRAQVRCDPAQVTVTPREVFGTVSLETHKTGNTISVEGVGGYTAGLQWLIC